MKLPVLLIVVLFLVLLIFLILSNLLLGSNWTGFVFGIISLICGTIVSLSTNEIKDLLSRLSQKYDQSSVAGNILNKLKYVFSNIFYLDLFLLTLSLMFLSYYFYSSIENTLTELNNQNYIAFPNEKGKDHLMIYMRGNIALPLFLGALGLYGIFSGFQLRTSFFKFLVASVLGMILSIVLVSLIKGGWTGITVIKKTEENNNIQLPDAENVRILVFIGLLLFFALAFAIYVWVLAASVAFLKNRLTTFTSEATNKQNINDATREALMEKLAVSSTVADEITSLKKRITIENLHSIRGVGNKTLEKAKQSFYFDE
jgi:hypothetical protein